MTTMLKDLVFKDLWLKLFSLALAALIWFTVNIAIQNQLTPSAAIPLTRTEHRTFANLPVLVVSSAQDSRSASVNPKEVEVTVEGDAKILRSLYNRDIRVFVDLTGIEAAHDLRKRVEVSTPAGVTHVTADPPEVQVIFPGKTGASDVGSSGNSPASSSNPPSQPQSNTPPL